MPPIKPDIPPDRFAAIRVRAERIGLDMAGLANSAHREGVLDGLEGAAALCDYYIGAVRETPQPTADHTDTINAIVQLVEQIRDDLRLYALQAPDVFWTPPEPSKETR